LTRAFIAGAIVGLGILLNSINLRLLEVEKLVRRTPSHGSR